MYFHELLVEIYFSVVTLNFWLQSLSNHSPIIFSPKLIMSGHYVTMILLHPLHHFILFLFEGNVLSILWLHILWFSHIFILLPILFSSFRSFFTVTLILLNGKIVILFQVILCFLLILCSATNTFTVSIWVVSYADINNFFNVNLFMRRQGLSFWVFISFFIIFINLWPFVFLEIISQFFSVF